MKPKLSVAVPAAKCVFGNVKCVHVFRVDTKGTCECTKCGSKRASQGIESDWYKEEGQVALGHNIVDIGAHITEQSRDCFHKEFEFLKTLTIQRSQSERLAGTEMTAIYRSKNRYQNIISYAAAQVWLDPILLADGTFLTGSEYINASYVSDGHGAMHYYVCAQAPLAHTCCDFWRLIYQRNIKNVVMLTELIENGKELCTQYWPSSIGLSMLYFGGIVVTMMGETQENNVIYRTFEVVLLSDRVTVESLVPGQVPRPEEPVPVLLMFNDPAEEESLKHHVVQYQFVGWSDTGVPSDTHNFLDAMNVVDNSAESVQGNECKILVHCSAGVGRTGAFIAVHRTLRDFKKFCMDAMRKAGVKAGVNACQQVEDYYKFNILETVLSLRFERPGMVQTKEQYAFCYYSVFNGVTRLQEALNCCRVGCQCKGVELPSCFQNRDGDE